MNEVWKEVQMVGGRVEEEIGGKLEKLGWSEYWRERRRLRRRMVRRIGRSEWEKEGGRQGRMEGE